MKELLLFKRDEIKALETQFNLFFHVAFYCRKQIFTYISTCFPSVASVNSPLGLLWKIDHQDS